MHRGAGSGWRVRPIPRLPGGDAGTGFFSRYGPQPAPAVRARSGRLERFARAERRGWLRAHGPPWLGATGLLAGPCRLTRGLSGSRFCGGFGPARVAIIGVVAGDIISTGGGSS
ncbi:hypothetical protein ABZ345_26635 [Lentzea sp. NPDC005914]|uniref:hypothetical protein n=1 Tax=Lentzea sp. NPDC005914 TaxID=3154572 RepID=UPI0033F639F9